MLLTHSRTLLFGSDKSIQYQSVLPFRSKMFMYTVPAKGQMTGDINHIIKYLSPVYNPYRVY